MVDRQSQAVFTVFGLMQRAVVVSCLRVKKNMRIVPLVQNAPYALDAHAGDSFFCYLKLL